MFRLFFLAFLGLGVAFVAPPAQTPVAAVTVQSERYADVYGYDADLDNRQILVDDDITAKRKCGFCIG
eukprot:CAMPEP_0118896786 /NCGR_PEP_ID=MMETSP1166-20130328/4483_1 /TAXON_ID=1104430 /ORGANISM="Chrysoreinhardia sp, Strain CCMP3193" /LENGTH=67 /DNA_ID=CAMNT_0006835845 /DNA_START=36 /DNA_END=239 /DNA_ORIENTATION=+